MLSLSKMYVYRLFRMRSFYVLAAISAALCLGVLSLDVLVIEPGADPEPFDVAEKAAGQFGGSFTAILLGIGASFVGAVDVKGGFVKNIAGRLRQKGVMVPAKLAAVMVEWLVFAALAIAVTVIFGAAFCADAMVFDPLKLACLVLVYFAVYAAFSAVVLFVCMLGRSSAPGIVVSLVLGLGVMEPLIYGNINSLLINFLGMPDTFSISGCFLETHFGTIRFGGGAAWALAASAFWLAAALAASFLVMGRRDV